MSVRLVLATHNAHKVAELRRILGPALDGIDLVGYDGPEPVEDGDTFEANALIKARAAAIHSGSPAIADDSGICVDALGGEPGIRSARYAGSRDDGDNLRLLLANLGDADDRGAQFACAAALAIPDGAGGIAEEEVVLALWPGRVVREAAGVGGFGYDPIFLPDDASVTAAELAPEEKDARSHRRRAFDALMPLVRSRLLPTPRPPYPTLPLSLREWRVSQLRRAGKLRNPPLARAGAGAYDFGVPKNRVVGVAALGPAFVAAIAYVDPGNVAANLTAGATHGTLLLWVLVLANLVAVIVQYQSAKLGIVTGRSLAETLGDRLSTWPRRAYWLQAELVAAATDIAEVIGGALALHLLFGVPLWLGGLIVGVAAMALLGIQSRRGQRTFEAVIIALLGVIVVGFCAGLLVTGLDPAEIASGLVPRFAGVDSVLLATSMLGATVMPHAIYLHSALARDRFGAHVPAERVPGLLRATRVDVVAALLVAGTVNIAMLLLAATALRGVDGTDTIEGAHAAIVVALGPAVGVVFAIGLLASGLASTSVGTYAGQSIMGGLLRVRVPVLARRAITLVPAVVVLAIGFDPTTALVLSQVVLSFGIPFAIVPLQAITSSRRRLGAFANAPWLRAAGWLAAGLIVALNILLLVLVALG